MEVFAAMIDVIDQNIGRLISDLETRGVLDKTLFFSVPTTAVVHLKGHEAEI